VFRDTALPRTTLLAAVCSDGALQKHLPQVRLPRARPERGAGPTVLAAYAAAGAPQAAYHGGSGWNNGAILVSYLRELRRRVARVAPGRPLVLVMDDSGIHTGDTALRECIRLRIAVVIIPSRMTWCLQPLDTHVFARLKAAIRAAVFERMAAGLGCRVAPTDRIRLHGEAIRRVLASSTTGVTSCEGLAWTAPSTCCDQPCRSCSQVPTSRRSCPARMICGGF
jgi:hypothetical protein